LVSRDSTTMPINMVTARPPSISRVVAAFLLFGGLKAGTPLEMASTPVSAAHPDENVRSSRNANAKLVRWLSSALMVSPALGARRSSPRRIRTNPVMIMPIITIMNPYVGIANAAPDSRMPRRFIELNTKIAITAMATLCSATQGTTEPRFATPDAVETATVST
jgi:hypothetical protein